MTGSLCVVKRSYPLANTLIAAGEIKEDAADVVN
jgi:hypothetical protein